MSHVLREIKDTIRDSWAQVGIAAIFLTFAVTGLLRWYFPDVAQKTVLWGEWYAIEAHYEPAEHTVVITSRAWIMRQPCPPENDLNRNIFIIDEKRTVHIFETAEWAPVINEPGAHVSDEDIVIPLTDSAGNRLHIRPERARIALTCGTRPPMLSADIPLLTGQRP